MAVPLTQLVYLRFRAGAIAVAPRFVPSHRVRINTDTIFRAKGDATTTLRTRVNTETIHRVRVNA